SALSITKTHSSSTTSPPPLSGATLEFIICAVEECTHPKVLQDNLGKRIALLRCRQREGAPEIHLYVEEGQATRNVATFIKGWNIPDNPCPGYTVSLHGSMEGMTGDILRPSHVIMPDGVIRILDVG